MKRGELKRKPSPTGRRNALLADARHAGLRPRKAMRRLGPRKANKMAQVRAHKTKYVTRIGGWIGSQRAAPCQLCGLWITKSDAEFSHKRPAGMGGAGDLGGVVDADNGLWSCRDCHEFVEANRDAHVEMRSSPASMAQGGSVEFSEAVRKRWQAYLRRKRNG